MKRIDLTGQRKERLLITGFSHSHRQPSGQIRAVWNAICDCGKPVKISTSNFTHGETKSCGCYIADRRKKGMITPNPESAGLEQYNQTKNKALKRNKEFNLTYEQYKEIATKDCTYCGAPPYEKYSQVKNSAKIKLNGIDRVNTKKGYTIDNCVPCCGTCNTMKMDKSLEEFLTKISEIYKKCL